MSLVRRPTPLAMAELCALIERKDQKQQGVLVVFGSSHRNVPPEVREPARKESSRIVGLAAACIFLLLVAAIAVIAFGFSKGRHATLHLKRGTAIRGIAQGLVIAEQGGVHFDATSDWKKVLIENGYVADAMFHHAAAVNGVMHYRIIWRGDAIGSSGNPTSWLCIYEDPASLQSGGRVNIMYASNHVASATRNELAEVIQHELRASGLELSESALQELSKR